MPPRREREKGRERKEGRVGHWLYWSYYTGPKYGPILIVVLKNEFLLVQNLISLKKNVVHMV